MTTGAALLHGLGFEPLLGEACFLEGLYGVGHAADLVAPAGVGHGQVEFALRQPAHDGGHGRDRTGDSAGDHPAEQHGQQNAGRTANRQGHLGRGHGLGLLGGAGGHERLFGFGDRLEDAADLGQAALGQDAGGHIGRARRILAQGDLSGFFAGHLVSRFPQRLDLALEGVVGRQDIEFVGRLAEVVLESRHARREALVAGGGEPAHGVLLFDQSRQGAVRRGQGGRTGVVGRRRRADRGEVLEHQAGHQGDDQHDCCKTRRELAADTDVGERHVLTFRVRRTGRRLYQKRRTANYRIQA